MSAKEDCEDCGGSGWCNCECPHCGDDHMYRCDCVDPTEPEMIVPQQSGVAKEQR